MADREAMAESGSRKFDGDLQPRHEPELPLPPTDSQAAQAAMAAANNKTEGTHNPFSLLEIAGKSALYSGIQAPLNGAVQLWNHVTGSNADTPQLLHELPRAQFNTWSWYAQTLGSGAGFMLPFIATEGLTRGAGNLSSRLAASEALERLPLAARFIRPAAEVGSKLSTASPMTKALIDGGLSGFLFTPSADSGSGFWKDRAISAAAASAMFGAQAAGARALSSAAGLDGAALTARTLPLRLGINATSGAFGGIAGAETSSLLSGNGLLTDWNQLKETAVAGAATGFALDAFHLARQGVQARLNAGAAAEAAPAGAPPPEPLSDLHDSRVAEPLAADRGEAALIDAATAFRQTDHGLLKIPRYEPVEYDGSLKEVPPEGVQQYRTTQGENLWQLPDGRIYSEFTLPNGMVTQRLWAPYGSEHPAIFLLPGRTEAGEAMLQRDDAHGLYRKQDGSLFDYPIRNDFATGARDKLENPLPADEATLDRLTLSVNPLEHDEQAWQRILPTANGKAYESGTTLLYLRREDVEQPPPGISQEDLITQYLEAKQVPTRTYRVLTTPQLKEIKSLQLAVDAGAMSEQEMARRVENMRQQTTQVVVPEDYARRLDELRSLRQVAVLSPQEVPELAGQIRQARRELFLSPYGERFLPEHWGQFLDTVPNRRLIKDLILLDIDQPEAWRRTTEADNPQTLADANTFTGRIRFFDRSGGANDHVRRTLNHEWSHLAESDNSELFDAYDKATRLERFIGRGYAERNTSEHWAVHNAEMFMDPNPQFFITLADRAPIRTVLLARALRNEISSARPTEAGINNAELQRRLDYVDEHVMPRAGQRVMQYLQSKDLSAVSNARSLIEALAGSQEHGDLARKMIDVERLQNLIDTGSSPRTRSGRFDYDLAARQLIRMEVLKQLAPEAFESRQAAYDGIADRVRSLNAAYLLDPDSGRTNHVLETAEQLMENPENLPLVQRVFSQDALRQLSLDREAPDYARQAFSVLSRLAPRAELHQFALSLLNSNSPIKDAAASYLVQDARPAVITRTLELLRKQINAGDLSAMSDTTIDTIRQTIDVTSAKLNSHFHPPGAIRSLQRAELLEDYLEATGGKGSAAKDPSIKQSRQIEMRLTKWFKDCLSSEQQSLRESALDAIAVLAKSPAPADRAIARRVAPPQVLDIGIYSPTDEYKKAAEISARLYAEPPR